jgi:hypothetical protein
MLQGESSSSNVLDVEVWAASMRRSKIPFAWLIRMLMSLFFYQLALITMIIFL